MKHRFWILVIAAVMLESIACLQYVFSRRAIRNEAQMRAQTELRAAELEINVLTAKQEAALEMIVSLAERYIDQPDSLAEMSKLMLRTMPSTTNVGIAFVENYFPKEGRWYEIYTEWEDGKLITREIGGPDHNYLESEWFNNGLCIDTCWWSEPYFDNSGAQSMVVTVSHPIRNKQGKIVAVAGIDLSLDYLKDLSQYLQVFKDSYYSIHSSRGMDIVAKPDTTPGRRYMILDEEIDATGWHISIIIPEEVLYTDLRRTGLIVTLLMILSLVILVFIMIRSARNVQSLVSVTAQKERMLNELEIAQTIQKAMLPEVFPPFNDRLDINIYGIVQPAKEIGGDLYDFYVRHEKLFFCIGDVSGKGVPAALLMAMTRSLFRSITAHEEEAAEIMVQLNQAMSEQNDMNMFVTLFLGILDTKTGVVTYCNAGHNAPMLLSGGVRKEIDVLPNIPLGVEPSFVYQEQSLQMVYNEMLFLYTDGLSEAENIAHEQFGVERIMDSLSGMTDIRPHKLVEEMRSRVSDFVGAAAQSDDLTMVGIRYQHPAIIMRNDIQQIPTLSEWVEGLDVPAELNMPINLALEELVANVMLYAYPGKQGQVLVEFAKGKDIVFTISDSGIPFDPTQAKEADISLSAEDREIGGLGIHLVRQIMDEIYYERIDNKNILTIVKHI